jgi:SAM-dependent methyltransferase
MNSNRPSDEDWLVDHYEFIRNCSPQPINILELGCSSGRDTVHLVKLGNVIATDIRVESLEKCARRVSDATLLSLDLSQPLPFNNDSFGFILASLSIHYFPWDVTERMVDEMKRCLSPVGGCIVRVNSTNDKNYGASSEDYIEPNYYQVGTKTKRFFDLESIQRLFHDWHVRLVTEKKIDRYRKNKWVWEVMLSAA